MSRPTTRAARSQDRLAEALKRSRLEGQAGVEQLHAAGQQSDRDATRPVAALTHAVPDDRQDVPQPQPQPQPSAPAPDVDESSTPLPPAQDGTGPSRSVGAGTRRAVRPSAVRSLPTASATAPDPKKAAEAAEAGEAGEMAVTVSTADLSSLKALDTPVARDVPRSVRVPARVSSVLDDVDLELASRYGFDFKRERLWVAALSLLPENTDRIAPLLDKLPAHLRTSGPQVTFDVPRQTATRLLVLKKRFPRQLYQVAAIALLLWADKNAPDLAAVLRHDPDAASPETVDSDEPALSPTQAAPEALAR